MSQLIYAFDSQQLSAWQMCEQKFDISYVQHLEERRSPPGIRKGAAMHKCYEAFYNAKIANLTYQEGVIAGHTALQDYAGESKMPLEELTLCMIKANSYFESHREELYVPLKTEIGFSHVIYETSQFKILYEGRIDLLVRIKYNNSLAWVDHKNYLIKEKPAFVTNQFYGYSWALSEIFPNEYAGQGFQDCTWMAESNKGPAAHDLYLQAFTKDQILEWKKQAIKSLIEMAGYMNSRGWPNKQAPSKNIFACTQGKYGGCKFIPVCHGGNIQIQEYQKTVKLRPKEKVWSAW